MQFKQPVDKYVRASLPPLPASQPQFITEELKKLERVLASIHAALAELEAKVT